MKRVGGSHHISRQGVHAVGDKVHKELKWLYREQDEDFGIDALIEVVEKGRPTGRLIAAQIKSGPSFFKKPVKGGYVFRGSLDHLDYWLGHRLPVIVVLFDPDRNHAIWQMVTKDTTERMPKGWKMVIPDNQTISKPYASRLETVAEGPPYFQRLAKFQLARPWMEALVSGRKLFIEAEEWVNKTSGKCGIDLILQDEGGEEESVQSWNYYVFYPGYGFATALQHAFPWADLAVDSDVYHEADRQRWEEECGRYDKEDNEMRYWMTFQEWKQSLRDEDADALRPYSEDGEIAKWRLELSLNDLGRGFLLLNEHLNESG